MQHTFDENTVSDLHKDTYGFRPSATWWTQWKVMSNDDKQIEWEHMCKVLDENNIVEAEGERIAYANWERHIESMMTTNNISKATAIRWDMDAMEADGDVGYYCYRWNISYSNEDKIKEILAT